MAGSRSGSGDAGAQGDIAAAQAASQARLARITSQGFQVDIDNVIGIVGQQLQEFDLGMGRQVGATALQLARAGALSRTRRDVAHDRTMGIDKFDFQENLEGQRDTLQSEIADLRQRHTDLQSKADYGNVTAAQEAAEELFRAEPTPVERDDFYKVDHDRYRAARQSYEDCKKREDSSRREDASDRGGFDEGEEGDQAGNTQTTDGEREERVREQEDRDAREAAGDARDAALQ